MVTFLIHFGMDEGRVLDADLISFKERYASATRVFYRQQTEDAWTAMNAAQGKVEDMKERTKAWQKATEPEKPKYAGVSEIQNFFGRIGKPKTKAPLPNRRSGRK